MEVCLGMDKETVQSLRIRISGQINVSDAIVSTSCALPDRKQ